MSISDADYAAWLRADNQRRCVLVEAQRYNLTGGAVVTRYMSNTGFISAGTDTPPDRAYTEYVTGLPGLRSSMADALRGRSLVSYGDLELDNAGGELDAFAADAWDGRPIVMYLGDPSWPKSDFRQVFTGAIQDIAARGSKLVLKIRDRQALLDVPFQTARIGGTGASANAKLPCCYGRCLNVTPVLEDETLRRYRVHDGQIQAVDAVYRDGIALATPADYTVDLSLGRITFTASVTGRITADVQGSATGGTYYSKPADLFRRILYERAGFSTSDVDLTSVADMNTAAPGVVGMYVTDDAATVRGVLDDLVTGVGGYYTIDRMGLAAIGLFDVASGSPVVTLTDDDLVSGGIELVRRYVPMKSVQLGYGRVWTVQTSGLAGGVSEARRELLSRGYAICSATNTIVGHLLATDGDVEITPYYASSNAQTEANRRAALWSVLRRVFRLKCFMAAGQVRIGSVVGLELSRYGLAGVQAVVVGINESLTGGWQELEVFL